MPSPEDFSDRLTIKLTCSVCHDLIEVELRDESYRIACPFCERDISVPSRTHVHVTAPRTPQRTPDEIGDYAVYLPAVDPVPSLTPPLRLPASRQKSVGFDLNVACLHCRKTFGTRQEGRSKRVTCPHCGVLNSIDGASQPACLDNPQSGDAPAVTPKPAGRAPNENRRKPSPRSAQNPVDSSSRISPRSSRASVFRPAAEPPQVLDRLAEVRQVTVPEPPRHTFFSGVFGFPWRRASLSRWGYLSFGWSLFMLIVATLLSVAAQFAGSMFGLILAFFALPMIWVGTLSCSYAAANFLCVVELTAAGQDEICDWPEPNWREWMPQLIFLVWIGAIPAVVAYAVGDMIPATLDQQSWVSIAILCVLYPICLMSALEANSVFVPVSWNILRSLFEHPGTWLLFLALASAVWIPFLLIFVGAWKFNAYLGALVFGPSAAALAFILARLFGRLAWKISGIEQKWAKIRVRDGKPAA